MKIHNREKKPISFLKVLADDAIVEGYILAFAPRLAGEIGGVTHCAE